MLSKTFVMLSLVLSIIALLLSSIALISANTDGKVIESLNWGFINYKASYYSYYGYNYKSNINYYVGVFGMYISGSSFGSSYSTKILYDQNCGDICNECQNSMSVVIGFLAVFIFICLFSIGFDIIRYFGLNSCLTKWLGIISSVLAIVMGLISLIVFASTCMAKVVKEFDSNNIQYHYGSAFGLLATAVCLLFLQGLLNIFVGVGEATNSSAASLCACCGPESCGCCDESTGEPAYQQPPVQQMAVFSTQPTGAAGVPPGVMYDHTHAEKAPL